MAHKSCPILRRIGLFIISAFLVSCIFSLPVFSNAQTRSVTGSNLNKVVILTFGDTKKSQSTIAKPILDQYGFKASFFITCSYANDRNPQYHLNWNDLLALQEDGQDIESKGMTPVDLNNLSSGALNYQ